ncbi:MAG: hypothetical protein Q4C61_15960 [Lachnospiraceae bacterium]|nr:hypothetical protein [Lachnospiraceae bacterium]
MGRRPATEMKRSGIEVRGSCRSKESHRQEMKRSGIEVRGSCREKKSRGEER